MANRFTTWWEGFRPIAWRLTKEYFPAMLLSLAWVALNWYKAEPSKRDSVLIISTWASAFFITGWFTSQFLRIKQQRRVDNKFATVEGRMQDVVAKVEAAASAAENRIRDVLATVEQATGSIVSAVTGAGSYLVTNLTPDVSEATVRVHNLGSHPVYDVEVSITDWDRVDTLGQPGGIKYIEDAISRFQINMVAPSATERLGTIKFVDKPFRRFEITIRCRSGFYNQVLRLFREPYDQRRWAHATIISEPKEHPAVIVFEEYIGHLDRSLLDHDLGWQNYNDQTRKLLS
jgi:hypothetical protein